MVTYTKEQRARAKVEGTHLVTIEVGGVSFQGPVTGPEMDTVGAFLIGFLKDHVAAIAAEKVSSQPVAGIDSRTVEEVKKQRGSVAGCCNEHADNKWCDCLANAIARERDTDPKKYAKPDHRKTMT